MWGWLLETSNYYFEYGDSLLDAVVHSGWARDKLNVLMLSLWSAIVRIHVISVLCAVFSEFPGGLIVDACVHTVISIVCTYYKQIFYDHVACYSEESLSLVNYLLDNYSEANYRRWKRIVLLSICIYGIVACLLFPINSYLIIVYILEYVVAFVVVDVVENKPLPVEYEHVEEDAVVDALAETYEQVDNKVEDIPIPLDFEHVGEFYGDPVDSEDDYDCLDG